jgi:hypothetical protein
VAANRIGQKSPLVLGRPALVYTASSRMDQHCDVTQSRGGRAYERSGRTHNNSPPSQRMGGLHRDDVDISFPNPSPQSEMQRVPRGARTNAL